MIENFKRMVLISDVIDVKGLNQNLSKMPILARIFEMTRSKISTSLDIDGKPNFIVVDCEPNQNDKMFVTTLIPYCNIELVVEDETFFLKPGDMFCSIGIDYKKISTIENEQAYEGMHFFILKYAIKEKVPHGNGPNKYKASIIFSDKYEIELFANSKEEAQRLASDIPMYDWDHVWNIDKTRNDEYRVQLTRHSLWLPKNIQVEDIW